MSARIFRVHRSTGNHTSSGGKVDLIEGVESLRSKLLDWATEAAALGESSRGADYHEQEQRRRTFRGWLERKRVADGEEPLPDYWTKSIQSVRELVNGEWVNLTWELIAPQVFIRRDGDPI